MKKLLFAFPIVVLLAAGCNSSQQASNQPPVQTPIVQNTNPTSTPTPTQQVALPSDWTTYQNPNLGISFSLPKNFQVFQTDANNLRIDSDYYDANHIAVLISMSIRKMTPSKTLQQVEQDSQPTGPYPNLPDYANNGMTHRTYTVQHKDNYDLVSVHDWQTYYYFVTANRGTFITGDTLDTASGKSFSQTPEVYDKYRNIFDQIVNSVKFN
jgi:hypothetical protein